MKKFLVFLSLTVIIFSSTCSCSSKKTTSEVTSSMTSSEIPRIKHDTEHEAGYQLDLPEKGEEIAVMKTNMGEFKLRFFPDVAPKAVENFKTHSKDGYYNNLIFHRVIENFMIQGGDPKGNGTGGESIWHEPFKDEFSDKLLNLTGAVAMANSGKDTNGSQFFINQGGPDAFVGWDRLANSGLDMDKIAEVKEVYEKNGGNPYLDGAYTRTQKGHTVFAQVFDGMDVVNKIAKVKVDQSDKPLEDVKIESIEITTYQ